MSKEEKKTLEANLKKKIRQLSALYDVEKSLSTSLRLDKILNLITRKVTMVMQASGCSLRLLDNKRETLTLKCAYGIDDNFFKKKKNMKLTESFAGHVVKEGESVVINDLRKKKCYKYPHLVKGKEPLSLITVPLVQKNKIRGAFSIYNKKPCKYTNEDVKLLSMFAGQAAIAIENARLYEQAEEGYLNTIKILSNIIDAKDSHTYGHSERVMEHCMEAAKEMKLSERDREILKYASLLHDIGKIGIDVGLLRKPSKLSNDEWKIMVMHPVLGAGIVEQIGFLSELAPIILRHHERHDGKGYPGKIKKEKIPLGAKILSVVDAYESMVSDRPYRKALSLEKAQEELLKGRGTQFDPKVVRVFLKILARKKKRW